MPTQCGCPIQSASPFFFVSGSQREAAAGLVLPFLKLCFSPTWLRRSWLGMKMPAMQERGVCTSTSCHLEEEGGRVMPCQCARIVPLLLIPQAAEAGVMRIEPPLNRVL